MTHPRLLLALVGLTLAVTGCGDDVEVPDDAVWASAGDALDPTALTWAVGGTVHIGDHAVETDHELAAYVVAGDSVWFVADDDPDAALWRAGPDGVVDTGAHAVDLLASPDGAYLSFIDDVSGPRDGYDTPQAQTVVVDLSQGREIVRSTAGMGDRGDDDLADLYEDAEFDNAGFTDDAAWFDTTDGDRGYDLATGEPVAERDRSSELYDELYVNGLPANPDHTWVLTSVLDRTALRPVGGGRPVHPRTGFPAWTLSRWLEDGRAVGVGYAEPPGDTGMIAETTDRTLITCTVPDGRCTPVPASTGTAGILLPESLRGR